MRIPKRIGIAFALRQSLIIVAKLSLGSICVEYFVQSNPNELTNLLDKTGQFIAINVKFLKKINKPVNLDKIKKNKELSHLALIKQSRLSVMPIDSKSWKILNKMSKI